MALYDLNAPVQEFAQRYPVMGTCAGMIMVAAQVDDPRVTPLQLIDLDVHRNAYGRQVESFSAEIPAPFLGTDAVFRAIFIRAPRIARVGAQAETLMEWEHEPIMAQNHQVLVLAFHPELTDDPRIHQYFLAHF
jgi:pyridoxal 5'-phosphate synthase pdxT subunit